MGKKHLEHPAGYWPKNASLHIVDLAMGGRGSCDRMGPKIEGFKKGTLHDQVMSLETKKLSSSGRQRDAR